MKGDGARRRRWPPGLLVGSVLVAAVEATELRKPREQRTWEGRILGFVPYDLRRPTLARFVGRLWNPSEPHVLVPTIFGVGWTINVAGVVADLRAAATAGFDSGESAPTPAPNNASA